MLIIYVIFLDIHIINIYQINKTMIYIYVVHDNALKNGVSSNSPY